MTLAAAVVIAAIPKRMGGGRVGILAWFERHGKK
jgi:hypothetical protein